MLGFGAFSDCVYETIYHMITHRVAYDDSILAAAERQELRRFERRLRNKRAPSVTSLFQRPYEISQEDLSDRAPFRLGGPMPQGRDYWSGYVAAWQRSARSTTAYSEQVQRTAEGSVLVDALLARILLFLVLWLRFCHKHSLVSVF